MTTNHLKLVHSRESGRRRSEEAHRQPRKGGADPLVVILPVGVVFASLVWLAAIYGTFRFFLG
jgi:hypothetical protein